MVRASTFTDRLARAYREARVLVLGDRTPKVDRALALHQEFLALKAAFTEKRDRGVSDWETTLFERTRRAIILTLRHQAITIGERWSDGKGSSGTGSSLSGDLERALQASSAAMELHLAGDPDVSRTAQVMEFIRQSMAQVKVDESRRPERPSAPATPAAPATSDRPATPGAAVAPSALDPAGSVAVGAAAASPSPATVAAASPSARSKGVQTRPRPRTFSTRTFWSLLLVSAAGLVLAVGVESSFLRIGKIGPAVSGKVEKSPAGSPKREVRAPQPILTPARVATILLGSEPSGARVTVGGEFRGTTPLNLEGKPGESMSIVLQKGNWVWRGSLLVGEDARQVMTVRLRAPRAAQTPRPQPKTPLRSEQARFETILREGIKLHEGGWFGPAAGRFKQALSIDPRSSQAYLWLGRALMRADRHAEARRALEKVIELEQAGPQADEAAALLSKLP